jgi:molybdopterin synthase catalytic subunit
MDSTVFVSSVRIQPEDFDATTELAALHQDDKGTGAICSFIGTVRGGTGDTALTMEIEHYPGMTERAIESMVVQAHQRFGIRAARVVHRIGPLVPGAQIVLVAVAASHRGASFQACEFIMDYLKTQAPFWKKEWTAEGGRWVDARESDDAALARWGVIAANR